MKKRAMLVGILCILSGCLSSPKKTRLTDNIENISDFNTVIRENIPLGTTVEEATLFMEQQGFECFIETEDSQTLFCSRHDLMGLFVTRDWMVSFPFEANRVSDVFVKTAFTGL